jgi:signal transduction histidine kinase
MRKSYFNQFVHYGLICMMITNTVCGQSLVDSLKTELILLTGAQRIPVLNLLALNLSEENGELALVYALEADSLSKQYENYTEQAFANRNIGDVKYYENDHEAALYRYNVALKLDEQVGNAAGMADDLYYLGLVYEKQQKMDEAISYFKKALTLYDTLGESSVSANLLYNIGALHHDLGDHIMALDYYRQSVSISDSIGDFETSASTLNAIGLLYHSWGDYESALKHYQQSLTYMEHIGNKTGMAQTINNIGILFYDQGQKDLALKYYLSSLKLEEEMGDEAGLAASYINIGIIYSDMNDNDKALEYFQNAFDIEKKSGNQEGISNCLNNIGDLYFTMGYHKQAIGFLKESIDLDRLYERKGSLAVGYNTLAECYQKLGDQDLAQKYNDSSFRLAEELKLPEVLMNVYHLYYRISQFQNDYKKALVYYQKYHALDDSMFSAKTLKQISVMQLKYEADKHLKEIELLSSKNKLQALELENKQMIMHRQRVIMYFALGGFVVIFFIALLYYYQNRQKKKAYLLLDKKNKEILEKRDLIIKAKEQAEESDKLKSSFLANISHELRTPLNGILGFAEILQKELDDPMHKEMLEVIHFSGMRLLDTLNSIIHLSVLENNKLELYITSFNLVDLIRERVLLYKIIAANKNLEIISHCQSDQIVIRSDPKILANVLNNLIDNAVKYTKDGVITVESGIGDKQQKSMVWIKVSDTGIGIPENRLDHIFDRFTQVSEGQNREYEGAGLGLTICKKYIEVLQGKISVASELGKGSQFLINLPLIIDIAQIEDQVNKAIPVQQFPVEENKPKILLLEKDEDSALRITKILNHFCEISPATDPDTALALAAENTYDGILIDTRLNIGMDGKITTQEIRKLQNHLITPIAALINANVPPEEQKQLSKNGFSYHLKKPFAAFELKNMVIEMISQSA